MAALSFSMRGMTAWNAASAPARVSAMRYLADGDAAPLELQLHGPQRGQHRRFGCRYVTDSARVPLSGPLPGAREVLRVERIDAEVAVLTPGLAFAAAILEDLARAVAGQRFVVVMRHSGPRRR